MRRVQHPPPRALRGLAAGWLSVWLLVPAAAPASTLAQGEWSAALQPEAATQSPPSPPPPPSPAEGATPGLPEPPAPSTPSTPPAPPADVPPQFVPAHPPAQAPSDAALEPLRAAHRSARAAILMSLPVPGWGQLYADSPFWASVAYGTQMWFLGNILLEQRRLERQKAARDREPLGSDNRELREAYIQEHHERIRDFIWWSGGALLVIALDSYVSVALADFDHPGVPTPDLDHPWPDQQHGGGLALQLHWRF
jgi:hypothetical protein